MRKFATTLLFNQLLICQSFGWAVVDSIPWLSPRDSVFLCADATGSKYLIHIMKKGQTIWSVARFYGLKPEALYATNPQLSQDGNFTPGEEVLIPFPDSALVKNLQPSHLKHQFSKVFYKVKPGDTFFNITKNLFQIPADTLLRRNHLSTTQLFNGQLLHVGWLSVKGISETLQSNIAGSLGIIIRKLQQRFENAQKSRKPIFHNGAAYWQREKRGFKDYYALHRQAPPGSVVQITNPMKKRTVWAEVVSPIPNRAYGNDIIIVLSPSIAQFLGAKDPKFFVEVLYFDQW